MEGLFVGRIRGTLKWEPLLNRLLVLLNRVLIQRVYIPKGPPNPIPYLSGLQGSGELCVGSSCAGGPGSESPYEGHGPDKEWLA